MGKRSLQPQTHYPAVIIGGGQAGLSVSYCLKERGIEHVIFEKHRIAHSWRTQRWDSFCLVTPNWQCTLPGFPYPGSDPSGFMPKSDIVAYVEAYAQSFEAPVREGIDVLKLRHRDQQFELRTSLGEFTAQQVVVATGGYHRPKIPRLSARFSGHVLQLHSSEYRNPEALPDGAVLVVGTGQSGCQIAEDLHLAGKQVHLCVGSAPRAPRQYRGRDVVDWLDQMGYYELTYDEHPQKDKVRDKTNHYVTGRDGGREIDLRQFALEGMQLHGRLRSIQDGQLVFQDDLGYNLDQADEVAASIKHTIDDYILTTNIPVPIDPPYEPAWLPQDVPLNLDYRQANITAVIWCTGYSSDYRWVDIPVFNGKGYPGHHRGVTPVSGLYFIGLPWLHTWGSARFSGIARDAVYIADYVASKHKIFVAQAERRINEAAIGS